MAGDWIKLQHWTPEKQEVYDMAEELGLDPDAVLGKLVRLWIWADQHAVDSNAASVTRALLIRLSGVTQFPDAMVKVGWLKPIGEGRFLLPNFDRHNGQTAKRRALTATRVAKSRENTGQTEAGTSEACNADVTQEALQKREHERYQRREEKRKRREEKTPPPPPKGEVIDWPERIYRAYPRKVAKPKALTAIGRAIKTIAPEALLAITEQYADCVRYKDQQFIPHPSTWFNEQRYADDPESWNPASKGPDLFGGIREFLAAGEQADVFREFAGERPQGGQPMPRLLGSSDGETGDEGDGGGLFRSAE